jgi:hypothetical protein
MKTNIRSNWHLLAALTTCAALAACGGGGGGSGGGGNPPVGGTPPPAPAPPPPPPPPTGANVTIDFATGKVWRYDAETVTRAIGGTYEFTGERVLYAERELSFQGRTAWRVAELEERRSGSAKFGFAVNTRYFAQGAEGLDLWVGTESSGTWIRLLSNQSLAFSNNGFLWAGDVKSSTASSIEQPVAVTVPAGNFTTVEAGVSFRDDDGGAGTFDVFENHHEYYADGVGVVLSTWDVEYDDNVGNGGFDSFGVVELVEVGPANYVRAEVEPDNGNAAQPVQLTGFVKGETNLTDQGTDVTDANVVPNSSGVRRLQDFYRFTTTSPGPYLVTLVDYSAQMIPPASMPDLDLYLFLETPGGLSFVGRSTRDPATNPGGEQIEATLISGNYVVAVQAWNTPGGAAPYWLSVR